MPPKANDRQVGGGHYKQDKIEHWDYVVANDIPYLEAQVIKYTVRHKRKNGLQDLEKAQHFLDKLKEVHYAEQIAAQQAAKDKVQRGLEKKSARALEAIQAAAVRQPFKRKRTLQ